MFCTTQCPSRTVDKLGGVGSRARISRVCNASTQLGSAIRGGTDRVHDLFHCVVVAVWCIVMAWHGSDSFSSVSMFVEIGARIVKLAGGFGLGSMAKACPRIAVAQASYSPPVRWFYWEPAAAK